jgi:thiol-disulfide isomerase/thioredoxin
VKRIFRRLAPALLLLAASAVSPDLARAQVTPATVTNSAFVTDSGRPVRLSDYRGKVVFVNFWGAWCTPCVLEMQSIRALQAALGGRGDIAFIFVSTRGNDIQTDAAWLRSRGIVGQSVRLASGSTGGMPVPSTFVIDASGNVAQYRTSAVDWVTHADFIRGLLQHRSV